MDRKRQDANQLQDGCISWWMDCVHPLPFFYYVMSGTLVGGGLLRQLSSVWKYVFGGSLRERELGARFEMNVRVGRGICGDVSRYLCCLKAVSLRVRS